MSLYSPATTIGWMNIRLSFVIPALNEADYIAAALDSIHMAMAAGDGRIGYEVIVADDGSEDLTATIARRRQARVVELRARNIAVVRNAGAGEARGDFLIFVDADTQVNPPLIHEAISSMMRGATWGTALAMPSDSCPLWAQAGLAALNIYYVRWRKCAYGFFFFVRRQVFWQLGGFPEDTSEGEDMAFSKRLVQEHGPPAVLHSRVATSARKAAQFGFWYHVKMLWLGFRYGDSMYTRPEIADYRDGAQRMRRP